MRGLGGTRGLHDLNEYFNQYCQPLFIFPGRSPICSTPRSSRKRLNTSRSDSETEIIWDANSPTAHLIKRSGKKDVKIHEEDDHYDSKK